MNNTSSDKDIPSTFPFGDKASIFFLVTTDITYDQRMIRICTSLAKAGYKITLIGRKMKTSVPLIEQSFKQKRIRCFFEKGKLFLTMNKNYLGNRTSPQNVYSA